MFVAWGVISARGISRISEVLLEERVTAAEAIAAIIAFDLQHVVIDVTEDLEKLDEFETYAERHATLVGALEHLRDNDEFVFFRPTQIVVLDSNGVEILNAGELETGSVAWIEVNDNAVATPEVEILPPSLFPSLPGAFAVVAVPLHLGTAFVITEGIHSDQPIPSFLPGTNPDAPPSSGKYQIEVLDAVGRVALQIGKGELAGKVSEHSLIVSRLTTGGTAGAERHSLGKDHIVAAAPIPGTGLFLVLEQEGDQALSVPAKIQVLFIVIGAVGFVVALVMAWLTTRRVVRPTLELAAAMERIANGDLESPVRVKAQDEIASLTQNVESMRIRLAGALGELESSNEELGRRVQQRTDRLTQALRQTISAQEGERQRVSRELHDDVAQQLIVLTRTLDEFRSNSSIPEHLSAIDSVGGLAREALATIRRVSSDLRPSVLDDLGLVASLNWVAAEAREGTGVQVSVIATNAPRNINPDTSLALFRIAQEAMHNVERHSEARTVVIQLDRVGDEYLRLTIQDDGSGFAVPESMRDMVQSGHLGLIGMRERADLIGGRATIESKPGEGTTVCVDAPLDPVGALPSVGDGR